MRRKNIKYLIFILLMILMLMPKVNALDYENLCSTNDGIQNAVRIIGYVVAIIKWVAPLIIIVLGMVDFGKAAISDDEKALSKATGALLRRIIAGVVIFFIPTLIIAVLNFVEITGGLENSNNFKACTECVLDVSKCITIDDETPSDKYVNNGDSKRINLSN